MIIYVSFENQIHLIFDKFWWLIKRLTRKFIRIVKHTKSQILFTSLTTKTFFIDILKYINHNYDRSSPWGCKMGQNIARIAKQSWSLKVFCSHLEKRVKFWPFHLCVKNFGQNCSSMRNSTWDNLTWAILEFNVFFSFGETG